MKVSTMSAVKLRAILSTIVILLILLAGVGFYFAQNWLRDFAVTVSQSVAQSKNSGTSPDSISSVQSQVTSQQDIIAKTNSIFTSASTYQTQAVQDLTTYAAATGITISNYSFSGTPTTVAAAGALPATQVTITLGSPVSYTSLLKFISFIEVNLPKMQITAMNIAQGTDNSTVKINQLTIAVYTR